MWSATATSGWPSVLKSPTAVDQPKGLAASPSLNVGPGPEAGATVIASGGTGSDTRAAPEVEEVDGRLAGTSAESAKHTQRPRVRGTSRLFR